MVDLSFDNSSFSTDGLCRATPTLFPRSLHLRSDSGLGAPLDWSGYAPTGTLASRALNVRLIMARDIPLQPFALNNFVNGVATDIVTLAAPATNVILRAIDSAGHIGDSAPFASISLHITSVSINGNSVTIRFPTLIGNGYLVESRSTLQSQWVPSSPLITGDGGTAEFTDHPPSQQHFYRIRLAP